MSSTCGTQPAPVADGCAIEPAQDPDSRGRLFSRTFTLGRGATRKCCLASRYAAHLSLDGCAGAHDRVSFDSQRASVSQFQKENAGRRFKSRFTHIGSNDVSKVQPQPLVT